MATKKTMFAGSPKFNRLQKHLKTPDTQGSVQWEYRLGELVNQLFPRGKTAYGQGTIQTLAEELGADLTSANRLWNARKLSVAINRSELDELTKFAQKADFGLTASHVLSLVAVKDEEVRKDLGVRCIKHKWAVKQLRREIHNIQGKLSGGGAKVLQPISVDEALQDLLERSKNWLNRYEQAWFTESAKSLSRPMSRAATDRLGNDLDEAIEVLTELRQAVETARRRLRQQRTRTAGHQD